MKLLGHCPSAHFEANVGLAVLQQRVDHAVAADAVESSGAKC